VSRFVPQRLLRDPAPGQPAQRALQWAVPDVAYTDPGDGKEKTIELKLISECATRYGREVAAGLCAGVNKRASEQQLYQEYLTRLRLKD
jgi:hypothetical protein